MKTLGSVQYICLPVILLFAGCAGMQANSGVPRNAVSQVACPPSDCDAYWRRAQAHAATHSSFQLRMATDVIIETFGPATEAPQKLAFGAIRDTGSIRLIVGCLDNLGLIGAAFVPPCEQDPRRAVKAWADYVSGATP